MQLHRPRSSRFRAACQRAAAASVLLLVFAAFGTARAQQPSADVVRGHVTNDSGHVVIGATVVITRGPDRLVQHTETDSSGDYSLTFDPGTGDYLVYVAYPGLKSARRRVQRQHSEHELIANFVLATDVALLAATKVTADKPARASNAVGPMQRETGSAENWSDGVNGQVPPGSEGDLSAIAGTLPGITVTPNGISVLGSGPGSNLTTLNGMGLATGSIPRAAHTETRVTSATYDATRGGFAGANIDVRLGPGSRDYQRRNAYFTIDPPSLQVADPAARQLSPAMGGVRGSFGADGEIIRRVMTYNVAVDIARSTGQARDLTNAGTDAFLRAGVAPDSIARIIDTSRALGLPLSAGGIPSNRQHDAVTWLGRLDDSRDSINVRALTTYVGYTRDGALGFTALAAPSTAGEQRNRTLGAQLDIATYMGPGRRVLNETKLAASSERSRRTPYTDLPGASVLVRSAGADATPDVASVSLGGNSSLTNDDSRWTLEGSNETDWNAHGRKQRFKAMVWGRADGMRQDGGANRLGSFGYNSIDDFARNQPTSYVRTLTQPVRDGSTWNTAAAFSHSFAPSRFFGLLWGARVEADGFGSAPARNPALEQALGVRTGAAPARLHVSPRVGFSYRYNRDRDNGSGMSVNNVGRFFRPAQGTLRGGIGEFRDLLRPDVLADAAAGTGLPGATAVLSCIGAAVPVADWSAFQADPASVPTECAGGGGVLAERAPAVSLIDPHYDVPRSWRASLDWSTSFGAWLVHAGALGSYDLSQPGMVDANFSADQQFTLDAENGRPMYVSTAAIDPGTGAVSAAESRRSDQFGRVATRVSDLRGYGEQLTIGVSPDPFNSRNRFSFYTSLNYTLQASRRQYRGFDGAAFGDPRRLEWSAGANDARHIVILSGGFFVPKVGTVTFFSRVQSGLPFTPIVQGDVNGDGRGGDRAYVPDFMRQSADVDPGLAAQLQSLVESGSESARDCIRRYRGKVADRNGCRGPWTQSLNMELRPWIPGKFARRFRPTLYFQNVLAGVDQMLHGSDGLRGWGSPAVPDPVLLVPRGFDAAAKRFQYDVNARFADTRPGHTALSNPFRLVLDFSMDLSTDYDLQQLRRAVEPVKGPEGWIRRSADSLTAFYLRRTSDIHKLLLEQSDSLFLTTAQIAKLRHADSVYSARVREIYVPLGQYLAAGHGGAGEAELDSVRATQKLYWKVFWEQPEVADSIITPLQRDLMPMLKSMLQIPKPQREHSQWQFGSPVTLEDKAKKP